MNSPVRQPDITDELQSLPDAGIDILSQAKEQMRNADTPHGVVSIHSKVLSQLANVFQEGDERKAAEYHLQDLTQTWVDKVRQAS